MHPFLTFINQQDWDLSKTRTLLAVSGGVDSVVLANLFHSAGFPAAIVHCNFGLRGEESERDEAFVRQLAANLNFDFYTKKFDIRSYKQRRGVSTQMAARDLRYEWFEQIRDQYNYDWIATAHHINDSVETLLLNLVRGTNLPGLTGISAKNDYLIRPLIHTTRQEILEYAEANDLKWREDQSNESDVYKRNLIRHNVTPIFKELNPALERTFQDTADRLSSANQVLNFFLNEWKLKHLRKDHEELKLAKSDLLATVSPGYFLWSVIQDLHFNYQQNKLIIEAMTGIPGKLFHSKTHTLLCDREEIIIMPIEPGKPDEHLINDFESIVHLNDLSFTFELQRGRDSNPRYVEEKNIASFDAALIKLPLKLRHWQSGDKFAPLGMGGRSKKVSDLFTDLKLNYFEKQAVWILENGNEEILWVVGYRMDDRYKVSPETVHTVRVEVRNAG